MVRNEFLRVKTIEQKACSAHAIWSLTSFTNTHEPRSLSLEDFEGYPLHRKMGYMRSYRIYPTAIILLKCLINSREFSEF
jgi:hypothetical protein